MKHILNKNLNFFLIFLRKLDFNISITTFIDVRSALSAVNISNEDEFFSALKSIIVKNNVQNKIFKDAFEHFFKSKKNKEIIFKLKKNEKKTSEVPYGIKPSNFEVIKEKDFRYYNESELRELKKNLNFLIKQLQNKKNRRFDHLKRGSLIDLKKTFRTIPRNKAAFPLLKYKDKNETKKNIFIICDISNSMEKYSEIFIYFFYMIKKRYNNVFVNVFNTELNDISQQLRFQSVKSVLDRIKGSVNWTGGTKIGKSIQEFNERFRRNNYINNSTILLITDGLESSDSSHALEKSLQQLRLTCSKLLWLNPLLRYKDYKPISVGAKKILPNVDSIIPAYNLNSIMNISKILND